MGRVTLFCSRFNNFTTEGLNVTISLACRAVGEGQTRMQIHRVVEIPSQESLATEPRRGSHLIPGQFLSSSGTRDPVIDFPFANLTSWN